MSDTGVIDAPADPVVEPATDPAPAEPVNAEPANVDPTPAEPAGDPAAEPAAETNPFYQGVEDWRQQTVDALGLEGDEADKELKRMGRYSDYQSYAKAAREAIAKIGRGEVSTGLPENPSDEQLAAYREANGIPNEGAGYEVQLPEGTVLSDADSRIVDAVRDVAHAGNIPNEVFSNLANTMLQAQQAETTRRLELDNAAVAECKSTLTEIWGSDAEYNANKNVLASFVAGLPADVRDDFKGGRLANEQPILANPSVVRYLVDTQRKVNPAATLVPNSANPAGDIKAEIAKLEARMNDDDWHKDTEAQARLRSLYDAEEQMKQNAA